MNPEDNSLESGYQTSESGFQASNNSFEPNKGQGFNFLTFKLSHLAAIVTISTVILVLLIGGSTLLYSHLHSAKNSTENSEASKGTFKVGSTIAVGQSTPSQLLQLGQVNELAVNGQLTVSKSVVLSPSSTPTTPVTGEIYYNQTSNAPYYYNGSAFVSLLPASSSPQHVTTLGGTAGIISLGSGLSINGNTLSVASSVLQQVSSTTNTPVVNSLQGLSGNVSFAGGAGIAISGTSITNTGVVGLSSSNNSINITNTGNGNYDLSLSAGAGSVTLAPSLAQADNSSNSSIFINKTGSGNSLELQDSGVDAFVVSQSGQITTGTIDYSQVQGRPTTVVNSLGGESGDITTGSGLSIAGNVLSNSGVVTIGSVSGAITLGSGLGITGNTLSNSGVTSLTGTANQVIASASTGGITLSLPQSIASSSSPTFNNQTLNGTLGVTGLSTLTGGISTTTLNTSSAATIQGALTADSTLNVQGAITAGVPGSTAGNIYLANTSSTNTVDLVGENPSGSGTATIQIPTIAGGSTDTVCLEALANCGTSSNTVTTSSAGNNGDIAEFTGAETIADSSISDNGSSVTISELLNASTINATTIESSGALSINPGGNLSVGAYNHSLSLIGNSASTLAEAANGYTDTLAFTAPTTTSHTITVPDATGTVCLDNSVSCGFATSGAGVTSLDLLAGALTINDSTGTGSTITIQNASTTQAGIAEFNSSDFQASGGVVDTIQGITTTSDVEFDSLALDNGATCAAGGNLCIGNSGTVYASNYSNPSSSNNLVINSGSTNVEFENQSGANSFLFPTYGGTGQTICTSGITCASGGGQAVILGPSGVQDTATNTTGIYVDKTGGTGNLLTLQTGSSQNALVIDASGNATFSNTTTAATLDVSGTLQAETITPNAALSVGSTSQSFTLQGNESSEILGQASGNSTYLGFNTPTSNTATTGSIYYALDNSAATNTQGTPYFVCTTAGNCSGSNGTVTALAGSSADYLSLFSATQGSGGNIENSIATETGSNTINILGNLNVGASGNGQLSVGVASSVNGTIVVNNATNNKTVTISQLSAPSSNVTLDLPTTSGTFAVSASGPLSLNSTTGVLSCPTCDSSGGGGSSAVQSLNTLVGAIVLNNASVAGQNIQINNAKADGSTLGIATFNSTNFTDNNAGLINTIQSIATTSSPTFSNLTLQGTTGLTIGSTANDGAETFLDGTADGFTQKISQTTLTGNQTISIPNASGTFAVSASGNLSLSALGNLTITSSPTFTTSVTTPLLASSAGLNITPGGTLTAGSTSQSFTLQGTASSTITATSGSFTSTLAFDSPTTANTIYLPNQGGTICLSSNNCSYEASGSYVLNQTTQQTSANIDIQSVASSVAAKIQGASGQNILNLYSSSSSTTPVAYFDSSGDLLVSTDDINGANITGGTLSGSTLSPTQLTFSGASGTISSTGNITIQPAASSTSAFVVQSGANPILTVDTTNSRVDIGTNGTASGQLYVAGTNPTYVGQNSDSNLNDPISVFVSGSYAYVASQGNNKLLVYNISSGTPVYVSENSDSNLSSPRSVYVSGNYAYVTSSSNNKLVVYNISSGTPVYVGKNSDSNLSTPVSLYISGDYAYVTNYGTNKLAVYNISSGTPVYVGENSDSNLNLPLSVYVQGDYAYVGSINNNKLVVYNISTGTPVYVGENSDSNLSAPESLYVQGNYAYVGSYGTNKLVVYNISSGIPVYVGENSDSNLNEPESVYVSGNYAYVTNYGNGKLVVYNIVSGTPVYVGENSDSNLSSPYSVYVQGNNAYVASYGNNKLVSYSLGGTVTQSLQAGSTTTTTLQVSSNAIVSGDESIQGGLSVGTNTELDNNLGVGGSVLLQNSANSTSALQVDTNSSSVLLNVDTTNSRIGIGQVTAPTGASAVVASGGSLGASLTYYFEVTAIDAAGGQTTVSTEVHNTTATSGTCTSSGNCEINVSWTSDPGAISYRVYYATSSGAEANYFTTSTNSYTLSTTTGNTSGTPPTVGNAYANQLSGSPSGTNYLTNTTIQSSTNSTTAFQVQNASGTSILTADTTNNRIDIGTQGTPSGQLYVSGTVPTYVGQNSDSNLSNPDSVYVSGNYAYVASEGNNKLTVYNISSGTPVYVSENSDSNLSSPDSVYVSGNYAYVTSSGNNKLVVYNISSGTPVYVSENSDSNLGNPGTVYVSGNYAYVLSYTTGKLDVYNIASGTPVYVSRNSDSNIIEADSFDVSGNYAYVTLDGGKLLVYNISSGTPVYVGENSDSNLSIPGSLYVSGSYVYVVNQGNNKLVVYNISSGIPVYVGENSDSNLNSPVSVYVSGNYAYVINYGNGKLVVYNISSGTPVYVGENSDSNISHPVSIYIQGNYAYVASSNNNKLVSYSLGGTVTQSLQAGSTTTTTLQVSSNAIVSGDESIQGGLSVGTNTELDNNLGVGGSVLLQNSANSTSALQVDTNSSSVLLNVDTTNSRIGIGQVTAPTGASAVVASGGSLGASLTYYFEVTAIDAAGGQTTVSTEVHNTTATSGTCTSSGNCEINVSWTSDPGAISYRVYYATSSGAEANYFTTSTNSYTLSTTTGNTSGTPPTVGNAYANQLSGSPSGTNYLTNTTIQSSTNSTTAFEVQNSSGYNVLNANTSGSVIDIDQLSTPSTVTAMLAPVISSVTSHSGSGTSYTYEVTAISGNGAETLASSAVSVSGNSSLNSSSNYNIISWSSVTGASLYKIYRTASSGTPGSVGLIGSTSSTSFNDTGYVAGASIPALATSGSLSTSTTYYYEVTAIDSNGGQTSPSAQVSQATSSSYGSITLSWAPVPGARSYDVYRTTTSGSYTTDSYYTVQTNNFTDTGATATGTNVVPPTTNSAYNDVFGTNGTSQVTIGSVSGSASTAQLDVAGSIPSAALGSVADVDSGVDPIVTQGNYTYMINDDYVNGYLQIIDTSNPSNPVTVSITNTHSFGGTYYVGGIAVEGNYVYIIGGYGEFAVYNVSNPASPTLVADPGLFGGCTGATSLTAAGNYVYVVDNCGSGTLYTINVSNPADPVLLPGSISSLGQGSPLTVVGSYLYLADGGMRIFSLSNPASPTLVSATGSNVSWISVLGRYAYTVGSNQLQVFDISNVNNPVLIGSATTGGGSTNVVAEGTNVYVTNGTNETLQTFSVANPYDPISLGSVSTGSGGGVGLTVQGNYAYVDTSANILLTYNIGGSYLQSIQAGSTETTSLQVDNNANIGGNESIQGDLGVSGTTELSSNLGVGGSATFSNESNSTTAFQVQNATGSTLLNVDTTNSRVGLGQLSTPSSLSATLAAGGSLPTGNTYYFEVTAIDAAGGQTAASGEATGSAATSSGNQEYTVSWTSDPGAISYRVYYATSSGAEANYFTTSTNSYTLSTTTGNTSGTPPTVGNAYANQLSGSPSGTNYLTNTTIQSSTNSTTAFQVQNASGTSILTADTTNNRIDIGTQGTPSGQLYVSGTVPTYVGQNSDSNLSAPQSVFVSGNYAYVASGSKLLVYNISSGTPVYVSENSDSNISGSESVYVQGNYAYVASFSNGELVVYNISSGTPVYVGENSTNLSGPRSVYVSGNYAYVASISNSKLVVFNIASGNPVYVGENSDSNLSGPLSVYVSGSYAYVASKSNSELVVYNISSGTPVYVSENSDSNLSEPFSVYVQGSYAYVASYGNNKLVVYNISSGTPVYVGENSDSNLVDPYSVYVSGNYAYVVNGTSSGKLVVYNISSGTPVYVGENSDSNLTNPYSVYVSGNYSYVASAGTNKLLSYSIGGTVTQSLAAGSTTVSTLQVSSNAIVSGDESIQGGLSVGTNGQIDGSLGIGGTLDVDTISGIGTSAISINSSLSQSISSGSSTGTTSLLGQTATNANTSSTSTTVNADSITLIGTNNSNSGANTLNGISFNNVTAATNNNFYGLYFGTGYSSILQYGSTQLISGTGTYTNTVQTTSTVQGSSVTATSTLTAGQAGSNGSLYVYASGGNYVALNVSGGITTSYSLSLPTAAPSSTGQCLGDPSSTSQLGYISCGTVTGGHTANIVLNAEYIGAALDAASDTSCSSADIGTMTSGYSGSASTPPQNYYEWTTSQSSSQCYDVVVQVPLPSDFGSFPTSGNTFEIYGTNSSGSNNTAVEVEPVQCNGSADPDFGSGYVGINTSTSWSQTTVSGSSDYFSNGSGTANYTSCGYLTLKVRLTASNNSTVQIGSIDIPYTTSATNN